MAVGAHLQPCTPIRKYVYINLHELLKCLCTFIIKFIIMQAIKYIYNLSMLVPSSAYLLQPFILKLIPRSPSQSILGCFAACVGSRRGYVCGGTHIFVGVAGDSVCGETCSQYAAQLRQAAKGVMPRRVCREFRLRVYPSDAATRSQYTLPRR